MSGEKRHNLSEDETDSDEEEIENLEVENRTTTLDNTVEESPNSSEIEDHSLLHHAAESSDVNTIDVTVMEECSHESLKKCQCPSESAECHVAYEFPSDDETENDSPLCQDYEILPHENPQVFGHHKFRSIFDICKEQKKNLIELLDFKTLKKETPDDTCIERTSKEQERKRKKLPSLLVQNKKQKEVESSCNPVKHLSPNSEDIVHINSTCHSSDEYADIEDNVKESSSSDNSDSNITNKTTEQLPLKDLVSDIHRNGRKNEWPCEGKSMKMNYESSSSNLDWSGNEKSSDKTAKKPLFPPVRKGETIPFFMISDEMKKNFEMSMPTIFEVRESESDEQIPHPMQSKTNPLKMKTKVVKRKDKCNVCNAKLGLCAIKCRCGGYYCAKHRYDKEHNCTFDYKSMGAAEIRKNNPKIVAEKVRKL